MSGGFFRGTSADQDTRFSNKQAKLLKSQKFAPELENLVDMTKVKMDVMRPWIAKRVTELIGFEDEVLINFIYTLLEGKEVNGKEIQISLTGFMERNTGKFMKELWVMLLSAQKNVSGVPQQFLDAKEEETRNKRAETDRIANEIQRKKDKEKEEAEQEKTKGNEITFRGDKKSDHQVDAPAVQPDLDKHQFNRKEEKRTRGWQSPDASYHSHSPREKLSTSPSKSSGSAIYMERKSRSVSRHSLSRSRSVSSQRRGSSPKRSFTPRGKHGFRHSPSPRRRSSYSRRRSTSSSPSRYRAHSPSRRRPRSPRHHRSRTAIRRSPVRYRSRTPLRYRSRSPMQHRSRSPRGRSPTFGRRKLHSPKYRNSPSPVPRNRHSSPARRRYRRSSSSPPVEHSESPVRYRSSGHSKKLSSTQRRGRSPEKSASPERSSDSLSPVKRGSLGERARIRDKHSPARRSSPSDTTDIPADKNPPGGEMRSSGIRPTVAASPRDISEKNDEKFSSYSRKNETAPADSVEPRMNDGNISSGSEEEEAPRSKRDKKHHEPRSSSKASIEFDNADGRTGIIRDERKGSDPIHPSRTNSRRNGFDVGSDDKDRRRKEESAESEEEEEDGSSYEDRKEAKRRRKEEKRQRREERHRRRREERHRRRDERRAEKKSSSASKRRDFDDDDDDDDDDVKLEIELREKALESLRAKKGGFGN